MLIYRLHLHLLVNQMKLFKKFVYFTKLIIHRTTYVLAYSTF
jgi:hypothetical protein